MAGRITRRDFLGTTAVALAAGAGLPTFSSTGDDSAMNAAKLPRWRGFNLLEKFTHWENKPFVESDLAWMKAWGFDFVRLPLSYWCWSSPDDWKTMDEDALRHIDDVVGYGEKHGIHVNINFHRGPGYCVNPPEEPFDLWTDPVALEACKLHWATFAKRYKGIPNERVSFDLLNEPPRIEEAEYVRVVEELVGAIRNEDPTGSSSPTGCRGDAIPSTVSWVWASRRARVVTTRCTSAITARAGSTARTRGTSRRGRSSSTVQRTTARVYTANALSRGSAWKQRASACT